MSPTVMYKHFYKQFYTYNIYKGNTIKIQYNIAIVAITNQFLISH